MENAEVQDKNSNLVDIRDDHGAGAAASDFGNSVVLNG